MDRTNKKTIGGIALAAVLVLGMFTFMPQSASADLTALDKFGTIINMITNIQNMVNGILTEATNIEEKLDGDRPSLITNINQTVTAISANVTAINATLQDKKSFYSASGSRLISTNGTKHIIVSLTCPTVVPSSNRGFNIEMLNVNFEDADANEFIVIKDMNLDSAFQDIPDVVVAVFTNPRTSLLTQDHLVLVAAKSSIAIGIETEAHNGFNMSVDAVGEKPQACTVSVFIALV